MKIKISILILCTFLLSCTMAPKYKRPDLPLTDVWSRELPKGISIDSIPSLNQLYWKEFFIDENLKQIIQITFENNKTLREAVLKAETAKAMYRVKRNDSYPDIQAEVEASRKKVPEAASSSGKEHINSSYDANLNTAYEIDLFGRVRSLNLAAKEEYLSLEETSRAVRISLIGEVASAYISWLYDKRAESIWNEIYLLSDKQLRIAKESYKTGLISKIELLPLEAMVSAAKSNSLLARKKTELDENALTFLLGKNFLLKYDADLLAVPSVVGDHSLAIGLPSEVLVLRPDILACEHTLMSMNANIGAVRAAYFPKISLTAAFGFSSMSLSDLFKGSAFGAWNFAPRITNPVFELGGNAAALKHSKVRKELAIVQYEKALQVAFREVNDELSNREAVMGQIEAQNKAEQALKSTYELTLKKVENGLLRTPTALEAQKAWLQSKLLLNELQKQQQINLVMLYKVLGGGFE